MPEGSDAGGWAGVGVWWEPPGIPKWSAEPPKMANAEMPMASALPEYEPPA